MRKFLTWLFWLFVGWCFLQSTLPTTGGDPCRTIMFAPKWYLFHGIQYHPWFDSFQFYEMLMVHLMRVIPDPGSTLSTAFMILAALTLWDMAERYWPNGHCAGPLAALLYVTIPISRVCSFYALNEHAMVFLFLLGLNGVLRYSEGRNTRWLVVGGICSGAACGVDINGLIPALLLIILAGRGWWVMLLSVIVGALPWYGMNILWYGNPIFPFHENWFSWAQWGIHENIREGQEMVAIREAAELGPHSMLFSPLVWACGAWFILTRFYRQYRNDVRGCILIVFVVLMLVYWICIEYIAHARFWMPMLVVLALMGGVGVSHFRWTAITAGVLIVAYMISVTIPAVPTSMAFGNFFRVQYLIGAKPGYFSILAVNENAPDCKAYLVDLEDYRFYCDFDIGGHCYGPESHRVFLEADDKYEWLRDRGYDFLLLNAGTLDRINELYDLDLPPEQFRERPPCTVIRIYELIGEN